MKTGKEIKNLEDIRMMVVCLCTTHKEFSKDEIYVLAQKNMEGSSLIVVKLLKTLINQVIYFLLRNDYLFEKKGRFYQVPYNSEVVQQNTI